MNKASPWSSPADDTSVTDVAVRGVTVRIVVDDLDDVVSFYEALTGEAPERFSYGEVSLARVGGFLLLSGAPTALVALTWVSATILVDDVEEVAEVVREFGGEVVSGPHEVTSGRNLVARHPDGSMFEYIDRRPPP
jgi:predicted enzyme related to lactoylglutathione lyase